MVNYYLYYKVMTTNSREKYATVTYLYIVFLFLYFFQLLKWNHKPEGNAFIFSTTRYT